MNIKQAKEEIKHSIQAYLSKDEYGNYKIPVMHQRPVLVIGPPGIGKTAIMEQVAKECQVGLVAYTITHHTRQSAIGLPFIVEKQFGDTTYSVTEYTMSEIIASVYEKIEQSGKKEGILFIDEINCVSETLSATMLQFLQGKSFGAHKVPTGWVIVAAGNPPEYNKSVKEFDIVTLDRVRKIDVVEDFGVWKEYASKQKVHNAILGYLEAKKEDFYSVETTVDGKRFVTARGWEDLSKLLYVYEELKVPVDEGVIYQFIQQPKIAKEFSNYLDLYEQYKDTYQIGELLEGGDEEPVISRLQEAPFDERLSVLQIMLGKLYEKFQQVLGQDELVTGVFERLKEEKQTIVECNTSVAVIEVLDRTCSQYEASMEQGEVREQKILLWMTDMKKKMTGRGLDGVATFAEMKLKFEEEVVIRQRFIEEASVMLERAFTIVERAFFQSQEMVMFITELTMNYYAAKFISEYGSEEYYKYNKEILLSYKKKEVLEQINLLDLERELV